MTIFNGGPSDANLSLSFIPRTGSTAAGRSLSIAPGRTMSFSNALSDLFGLVEAAGALLVEGDSVAVVSAACASARSTCEFIPAIEGTQFSRDGDVATMVSRDASPVRRLNVGWVSLEDSAFELTLRSADGSVLARADFTAEAGTARQLTDVAAWFGIPRGAITSMDVAVDTGELISYGARVIGDVGDPDFQVAEKAAMLIDWHVWLSPTRSSSVAATELVQYGFGGLGEALLFDGRPCPRVDGTSYTVDFQEGVHTVASRAESLPVF